MPAPKDTIAAVFSYREFSFENFVDKSGDVKVDVRSMDLPDLGKLLKLKSRKFCGIYRLGDDSLSYVSELNLGLEFKGSDMSGVIFETYDQIVLTENELVEYITDPEQDYFCLLFSPPRKIKPIPISKFGKSFGQKEVEYVRPLNLKAEYVEI